MQQLWKDNQKSLLTYLAIANTGIRGIVKFSNGELAKYITVKFDSREPFFKTNKYGEYFRILLPGTYQLELMFNCVSIYKTQVTISGANGGLLELNITLSDENYQTYKTLSNSLNRYSQFCTSSKAPVSCSTANSFTSLSSSTNISSKFTISKLFLITILIKFVYISF